VATKTLSNGFATLVVSNLPAGTHTVSATYNDDTNFTGSTSADFTQTVVQQSVTRLSAVTTPTLVGINTAFSLTVKALDASNNVVVADSGAPVSITLVSGPALGALTGSLTGTLTNGVFTFTGLKVTRAGSYTVRITANGLTQLFTFSTLSRQT
jgi:hypothetical protein